LGRTTRPNILKKTQVHEPRATGHAFRTSLLFFFKGDYISSALALFFLKKNIASNASFVASQNQAIIVVKTKYVGS